MVQFAAVSRTSFSGMMRPRRSLAASRNPPRLQPELALMASVLLLLQLLLHPLRRRGTENLHLTDEQRTDSGVDNMETDENDAW
jgi:hypothetical protein